MRGRREWEGDGYGKSRSLDRGEEWGGEKMLGKMKGGQCQWERVEVLLSGGNEARREIRREIRES